MSDGGSVQPTVDRRSLLGAGAASLFGSSGCIGRVRNAAAQVNSEQLSLTIKTTPADDDPYAIRIAQRLAANLDAAGIDVQILPMRNDQLLQDVLVDQSFDLYVGVHPGDTDPDFLYPLVHSRYTSAPGWQNTFGYADEETDGLLETQRRQTGSRRRRTISELQHNLATDLPFLVVAFPDAIRAVRAGEYEGWMPARNHSLAQYLALEKNGVAEQSASFQETTSRSNEAGAVLRVGLTDGRATENLNPIAVTFRNRGAVTDLLYDSLLFQHGGDLVPWLATDWRWVERDARSGPVAVLRIRDGAVWHDDRPISADDVAFTYRFFADTSLGRQEQPVPAPRFRGAESLVERTAVLDDRTIRIEFGSVHPSVAERALTVPILPEHVWRPRSRPAEVAGLDLFEDTPEALVWSNMEPIGSGPLQFREAVKNEVLILDRFDDHFLWDSAGPDIPERLAGELAFDRLVFRIVPSDGAAIELIEAGEIDASGTVIHATAVPGALKAEKVGLTVRPSRSFYHVGFNTRRDALSNPRFRRAVARLLDKEHTVAKVFHGYAIPATSPLARSEWVAPDLEWQGDDPVVSFAGEDGRLDVEQARASFEDAGYRYDTSGRLLRR